MPARDADGNAARLTLLPVSAIGGTGGTDSIENAPHGNWRLSRDAGRLGTVRTMPTRIRAHGGQ